MRALIALCMTLAFASLATAAPLPGIEPALPANACRAAHTVGGMADSQYQGGLMTAERALEPLYGSEALEPLYGSLEPLYGRVINTLGRPSDVVDRACEL